MFYTKFSYQMTTKINYNIKISIETSSKLMKEKNIILK